MSDPATLAQFVRASGPVLTRFLAGFDDGRRTWQAPGQPNHVAWTLGHCAYTMGRLTERFEGPALPAEAFLVGDGTQGDADRYDTLSVRLASEPVNDSRRYPVLARGIEIFESAVETLAGVVEAASQEMLGKRVSWGSHEYSLRDLVFRVSLHNAQHAGQLADLRRGLGMPRIAG